MMHERMQLGRSGEALVANHLVSDGFKILARNYTHRSGEIDLIAQKKKLIVFVEVKARMAAYFDPCELIIPSKQRKIIATAKQFLIHHKLTESPCRFDIAVLVGDDRVNYIADAFSEGDI